jgi:hypothetical protein
MTALTDEQLTAFIAFGLLIMHEPESLLVDMSRKQLKEFAGELDKYLSPLVNEELDVVSPIILTLKTALEQVKGSA